MSVVEEVARVLDATGAPWALVGARAVAVRGFPRMTLDYDFMSAHSGILERSRWDGLVRRGAAVNVRKGDEGDPIAGVVHLAFADGMEADVLLARWDWEREILSRAERLPLSGVPVPVPRTSDLILLKLAAGGPIDLQDVVALVNTDRERLTHEVDRAVGGVRPDVTQTWEELKRSMAAGS